MWRSFGLGCWIAVSDENLCKPVKPQAERPIGLSSANGRAAYFLGGSDVFAMGPS
jgi:hypothetical protein